VNGLVEAGIVSVRGGKVRLVRRDELPDDWDPATDARLTVWETAQHLIRALENGGESGAAELLRKLGSRGETARSCATGFTRSRSAGAGRRRRCPTTPWQWPGRRL